ncbi:mitotic-spindle organizing protein 2 [Lampris incognitus]|uniref:mitotic-spindle organizing protein 2 n=1 Tax=Lampris incognitus TaxID=2546036 RepID=UPI0024B5165C|nr:mitotic-spindle organizing protein 2 [Lampris incognitus]XP_056146726.1 mitotic-spindle organizing protein 2 [Lampris incognitus]
MAQQSQPGPLPAIHDPAGLVVTANVQKVAVSKKKVLSPEDSELFELTQAAGITMDQEVFKIMVDLLKMNVAPQAVFQTLKAMCAGQRIVDTCGGESSAASNTTGTSTAPAEHRENATVVPSKSAKSPLPPYSARGAAARVSSKAVVYSSQDGGSATAQVRSKAGQKVQRHSSATRGQKTKSSGSSSSSSQMTSS